MELFLDKDKGKKKVRVFLKQNKKKNTKLTWREKKKTCKKEFFLMIG